MKDDKKTKSVKKRKPESDGKLNGLRSRRIRIMIAAVIVAALFAVVIMVTAVRYRGQDRWVTIPANSSSEAVRDSLVSALGLTDGNVVYDLWRMLGGGTSRAAGAYQVRKGQMSLLTAWRLSRGTQTPVSVSWSGVRTMDDLAKRLSRKFDFTAKDFLAACDSILPSEGFRKEEFPAAFMPDKYEFYRTASASTVVRRMLEYRNKFWTEKRTAKARELGLTPIEAATLASIVEEETAKKDEMPVVARLYLNRLAKDMPLQADPTVKFAVGDVTLRRITGKHLKVQSPYNTYIHRGLPPGPIRLASRKVIEKVLEAPEHEFLYMCAREDFSGYHNFAEKYSDHQANAARYQAELDKRGIH